MKFSRRRSERTTLTHFKQQDHPVGQIPLESRRKGSTPNQAVFAYQQGTVLQFFITSAAGLITNQARNARHQRNMASPV